MFKLRAKFFSIIFIVNVILLGATYAFLHLSFDQAFDDYISQRSRDFANGLAGRLEEHYQSQGNWSDIASTDQTWTQFIFRNTRRYFMRLREPGTPPLPNPDVRFETERFETNREELPRGGQMPPMFLLDAKENFLVGIQLRPGEFVLRELVVNNQIVGYLGIPLDLRMRDYIDNQLAAETTKHYTQIVMIALAVAFITAIPLSSLMVSRIHQLVGQVQHLSRGEYRNTLKLRGKDELNTLAEHLDDLARSLEKSEQQRNQWVADISHELRTPVAILQADLEAMEDGIRDLDLQGVQRLHGQVVRLKNLVKDLNDLSLSDVGSLTYRKEICDVNEVVVETVDSLQNQFKQKGLELQLHSLAERAAFILGDHQRLTQLFLNLLQNSLKYTDVPGIAVVSVKLETTQVVISVNDSSPGVATELQPRLTERLFRVENSRNRDSGGAGLGLSLCANIVDAHSGTLTFSDSPLGGLCATVTLPLSKNVP